jgi:hypothetical protein
MAVEANLIRGGRPPLSSPSGPENAVVVAIHVGTDYAEDRKVAVERYSYGCF